MNLRRTSEFDTKQTTKYACYQISIKQKQTHMCEQRAGSDSKSSLSVEIMGDDTEQTSQLCNVTFTRGNQVFGASLSVWSVVSACVKR